jgi:hypothetical protein
LTSSDLRDVPAATVQGQIELRLVTALRWLIVSTLFEAGRPQQENRLATPQAGIST